MIHNCLLNLLDNPTSCGRWWLLNASHQGRRQCCVGTWSTMTAEIMTQQRMDTPCLVHANEVNKKLCDSKPCGLADYESRETAMGAEWETAALSPFGTTRTKNSVVFDILNWILGFWKCFTNRSVNPKIKKSIPQWIVCINCLDTNWPWSITGRRNTQTECSWQSWQVTSKTFDICIMSRKVWGRKPGLIPLAACPNITQR